MTTTYPLPTLAAVVDENGITAPAYSDIYKSLQASFQGIFGSDSYIDPDSQDGQMLAVIAKAITDCNLMAVGVYNSFSPQTAVGNGLSNVVKINGITRLAPSNSTALLRVVGPVGTTISNGVAADSNQNRWNLPALVIIPTAGQIDVTATCQTPGAVTAGAFAINQILTPTLGWQTVTNPLAASPGAPVETDAALRQRQKISTAQPSITVLAGIVGAVQAVPGVTSVVAYENDTGSTDANGLPAHSISLIVLGGDSTLIAQAIAARKTPGAYTHGSTAINVPDSVGVAHAIRFYIAAAKAIKVNITLTTQGVGYTTAIGDRVKQSLIDWVNALPIGQDVIAARMYMAADLYGDPASETYYVSTLNMALSPTTPTTNANLVIGFNEHATLQLSDIAMTVV